MFYHCENLTTGAKIVDTYKLPAEVTDLSYFLLSTHYNNTNLKTPIDLSGLEGWFNGNTSITNLSEFLSITHFQNTSLKDPIDLSPLSGWFSNNNKIMDLSDFISHTHEYNTSLKDPIKLSPLKDWFSNNTSITNLELFFAYTHNGNTALTSAIDLTQLSGWFDPAGRSIANLEAFLFYTHKENPALNLTGQKIFPDWIQTLKEGTPPTTTPIKDAHFSFKNMFSCSPAKPIADTGEPKFEDGSVLSSLGTPSNNNSAYTGRTGFSPVNTGWQ
jgi:hypothetical protein